MPAGCLSALFAFTSQLNWLLLTTPLAMFQVAVGGSDVDFPVLARAKRPPFALL